MGVVARPVLLRVLPLDQVVQVGVIVGRLRGLCLQGRLFRVLVGCCGSASSASWVSGVDEAELFKLQGAVWGDKSAGSMPVAGWGLLSSRRRRRCRAR